MSSLPFENRKDAANRLVDALAPHVGSSRPLVLSIPRGGVPLGRIIADALGGELDVVLVRKLGAPDNPEFAIGAIDEQGRMMLTSGFEILGPSESYLYQEARRQLELIHERRARYRPGRKPVPCAGRTVIVVDDGLATGATMMAALDAVRAQEPQRLICAVPVAARDSLQLVASHADEIVCLATPEPFIAVGRFYRDFSAVGDDEVIRLLNRTAAEIGSSKPSTAKKLQTRQIRVNCGSGTVEGELVLPETASGLVLFVHGSGSSRHSPRNKMVAKALNDAGFATLLFDLLTPQEDRDPEARFDISLLANRLETMLDWVLHEADVGHLPIGLFGASTGAAAALRVAANRPEAIRTVVSRGGRPDMAGASSLSKVRAAVLLIVGSRDMEVLELNRLAQDLMPISAKITVIPGATHLFEEAGTLEQVSVAAINWFSRYMQEYGNVRPNAAVANRVQRQ